MNWNRIYTMLCTVNQQVRQVMIEELPRRSTKKPSAQAKVAITLLGHFGTMLTHLIAHIGKMPELQPKQEITYH